MGCLTSVAYKAKFMFGQPDSCPAIHNRAFHSRKHRRGQHRRRRQFDPFLTKVLGPSRVELEKKFFWIWFIYTLEGYVLGCTYFFFEKVYF